MARFPIFLILAFLPFSITACDSEKTAPSKSLNVEIQRDSVTDFYRFLEAIKLLIPQSGGSLEMTIGPSNKKLSFTTPQENSLGCPIIILISHDQIWMRAEGSNQEFTIDELQKRLGFFAKGAQTFGAKAGIGLYCDRQTSGEFGLTILNLIADSGISTVMLSQFDLLDVKPPSPAKKTPQKPASPRSSSPLDQKASPE